VRKPTLHLFYIPCRSEVYIFEWNVFRATVLLQDIDFSLLSDPWSTIMNRSQSCFCERTDLNSESLNDLNWTNRATRSGCMFPFHFFLNDICIKDPTCRSRRKRVETQKTGVCIYEHIKLDVKDKSTFSKRNEMERSLVQVSPCQFIMYLYQGDLSSYHSVHQSH
jgi:hypothetical protein